MFALLRRRSEMSIPQFGGIQLVMETQISSAQPSSVQPALKCQWKKKQIKKQKCVFEEHVMHIWHAHEHVILHQWM